MRTISPPRAGTRLRAGGRLARASLLWTLAAGSLLLPALVASAADPNADEPRAHHQHYAEPEEATRPGPGGVLAPRLQGLGSHRFAVPTCREAARPFLDQGLRLSYAFNHAEAGRAFREAARLDPDCAMAYWGQALVLGPNINAAMDPAKEAEAHALAQKALELAGRASEAERAYVRALSVRYTGSASDRRSADLAYASAMRALAEARPGDLDAAMLWVESMMDLRPWAYWERDGTPAPGTAEIVARTEAVLQRDPLHPGALHLYIHLMEPTDQARRAESAADRLIDLMPSAGHMVHMPSHVYQRIGRYADAARSNELAIAADESYITQCRAQGLYPAAYYPHNIHFLWFAATMEGRSAVALDSARKVAAKIDDDTLRAMPMLGAFRIVPYYALTRFGRWDEMLAEPAPPEPDAFVTGTWHYARGLAWLAKGERRAAKKELSKLREIATEAPLDYGLFSLNTARAVLAVAVEVLRGEVAAASGDFDEAVAALDRAVRLDDALAYTEPFETHFPPRHALGAVLLAAGRAAEAETVYWQDLARSPGNGWALAGLARALAAQGKNDAASEAAGRRAAAFARADLEIDESRLLRVR